MQVSLWSGSVGGIRYIKRKPLTVYSPKVKHENHDTTYVERTPRARVETVHETVAGLATGVCVSIQYSVASRIDEPLQRSEYSCPNDYYST